MHQKSIGISIVEMLLVLTLGAMMIIMSIRYYQSVTNAKNELQLTNMMASISKAANEFAAGSGAYDGLTLDGIKSRLPSDIWSLKDPWHGDITITAAAGNKYTTTFAGVPKAVCTLVTEKFKSNTHYKITCSGGLVAVYRYLVTPPP